MTKNLYTYQMPWVGKEGPQSQMNDRCSFLIMLMWHSPWYWGGTQVGE